MIFGFVEIHSTFHVLRVVFFFCHRIMVFRVPFSVSIEVIMWVFILSRVSMVCYAH